MALLSTDPDTLLDLGLVGEAGAGRGGFNSFPRLGELFSEVSEDIIGCGQLPALKLVPKVGFLIVVDRSWRASNLLLTLFLITLPNEGLRAFSSVFSAV